MGDLLDALRATCASRFGMLTDKDANDVLTFWDPTGVRRPSTAYVTLTESGQVAVLPAAVPYCGFHAAMANLAESRAPLLPFTTVPENIDDTFYTALLLVPAPFADPVLVPVDGPLKDALVVVPVTEPERRLVADAPRKVLALLRAAAALVTVPIRDCVVAPELMRWFRVDYEQAMLSIEGRRCHASLARLRLLERNNAPRCIMDRERIIAGMRCALLHYLDTGSVAPPPEHTAASARHVPFALHRATPPGGARIARRALVLAALLRRARIERDERPDAEARREEMLGWMEGLDLASECEPFETELLEQPVGHLAPRYVEGIPWLAEGLAVLAWALHRAELPAYDERAPLGSIARAIGFLRDEARSMIASPAIRSEAELRRYLDHAYAICWRSHDLPIELGVIDFARLGREQYFWFGRLALDGLPLADGDLVVFGAPLFAASPEVLDSFHNMAIQRLRAATWLLGVRTLFSEAPCAP